MNATIIRSKRGLVLLALLAVGVLVLSGCIATTPPAITDNSIGSVKVQQGMGSAPTTVNVEEYGAYYSTSRSAVVDVDASESPTATVGTTIVNPEGASQARVLSSTQITPSDSGTLSVDVGGLQQGTTYFFRFYALGHLQSDPSTPYRALYTVAGHTTLSHDATLKSIKTSVGKLSPKFKSTKTKYTNTWPAKKKKATITVASTRPASTVQIRIGAKGAWATKKSVTVSLSKGKNKTVYIRVTATDKSTKKTYTVKVARKKR